MELGDVGSDRFLHIRLGQQAVQRKDFARTNITRPFAVVTGPAVVLLHVFSQTSFWSLNGA